MSTTTLPSTPFDWAKTIKYLIVFGISVGISAVSQRPELAIPIGTALLTGWNYVRHTYFIDSFQ